jgi:hypothetical protein
MAQMANDANSERDWVKEEFVDDPIVQSGLTPVADLPLLDKVGLISLLGALHRYKPSFRGVDLDLYVVSALEPVAKVCVSKRFGQAVAVVSIGLVRLLSALCGRVALSVDSSQALLGFLSPTHKRYQIKAFPNDSAHEFRLSKKKQRCSGLTKQNVHDVLSRLSDNNSLLFCELLSAALEFTVLHEASHVVLRHREASELFRLQQGMAFTFDRANLMNWEKTAPEDRYRPEIRMARCFEHQADYLALVTMSHFPPLRPCLDGTPLSGRWAGSVCKTGSSRRYLGLLGAGLALALVALLQAPEPDPDFNLNLSPTGSHPAAALRLPIAIHLFTESLRNPFRRLVTWPGSFFQDFNKQLGLAQWLFNIVAMGSISSEWDGIMSRPGKEWPKFLQNLFLQKKSESPAQWSQLTKDFARANELVRAVRKTWSSSKTD